MTETIRVVAQPSEVPMQVRVDLKGCQPPAGWDADVAEAVDSFVYSLCETCGFDVDAHVVTVGPFGNPFLYCERGEE